MTSETNSNGQTHIPGRENRQMGHIAHWLPLGIGTGVALGVTFDNLALGIAIGAAVSAAIGMAVNLNRMGAGDLKTGTPGGRLIVAIAIGGLAFLAVGAILLYFLTR
jgi:hypothetical protein